MIEKTKVDEKISTPVSSATAAARPIRVLLVEDDRSLRRYLEVVLRRQGYEVLVAVDGLEAMRTTLTSPVDLVVTDAIMPNLNGHELVRFLRNTPHLSHLPIVLLSALEIKEGKSEDQRADVYLSKPISPEVLIACVQTLMGQRS
jgi:DNA-binding response OmpR family regulator